MANILNILQIIISVLLIAAILLQQKGSGLGTAFGGDSGNIYSTRRGAEKIIFYATIALAVIFILISIIRIQV